MTKQQYQHICSWE